MNRPPTTPDLLVENVAYGQLQEFLTAGAEAGSTDLISKSPCSLVPPLQIPKNDLLAATEESFGSDACPKILAHNRNTFRIWFAEQDEAPGADTWESLIHGLRWTTEPHIFLCTGNAAGIQHRLITHQCAAIGALNLLRATFPQGHIQGESKDGWQALLPSLRESRLHYRAVRPPAPLWGLFNHESVRHSVLYSTMAQLEAREIAFYEVVLLPVPSNWRSAIQSMARAEAIAAQRRIGHGSWIFSKEADQENDDKLASPLYAATIRIGLFTHRRKAEAVRIVNSLLAYLAGLRFSGAPIQILSESAFRSAGVTPSRLRTGLLTGSTHVPGVILSPSELSGILPRPAPGDLGNDAYRFDVRPPFIAGLGQETGIKMAEESVFGRTEPVIWPETKRRQHMIVSGATGFGKTVFLTGVCSRIVNEHSAEGLALIDPHDTAIDHLLQCVGESRLEDCILHDPMDEDYVFCLPLFDCPNPDQVDLATSNISHQICSVFSRAELGFNIVRGIKNVVRTLLLDADLSLVDVRKLVDPGNVGAEWRERVAARIQDEMLIEYWAHDFDVLDKGSVGRIQSRFEHLLEPRRLRSLLANKLRKTAYSEIMAQSRIFLARTCPADAGPDLANTLGTLHLTGFQSAGYSRQRNTNGERPVFTLVADEFGNYSNPRTVSHALRTLRKFDVSEILVTQNIEGLPQEVKVAIGNINTHVVFQQSWDDAHHYFKTFCGAVPVTDFVMKNVGEGYAKVGTHLAAIRCPLPAKLHHYDVLQQIREQTRRRYCISRKEFTERMIDEKHASIEDMKDLDMI